MAQSVSVNHITLNNSREQRIGGMDSPELARVSSPQIRSNPCDMQQLNQKKQADLNPAADPGFVEDNSSNNSSTANSAKRQVLPAGKATKRKLEQNTTKKDKAAGAPAPKRRRGKKRQWVRFRRRNGNSRGGGPKAPFNSTQFLMNDHSDTVQYLDMKLGIVARPDEDEKELEKALKRRRVVTRARESSFSLNSDEEFFYSSPEDEEAFLSAEFLKDYANIRADSLVSKSKSELIAEYLQMEERCDALEERLQKAKRALNETANSAANSPRAGVAASADRTISSKIRQFKREIAALDVENRQLRRENRELRRKARSPHNENDDDDEENASVSSTSSSSSSCSSSSCSSSSCSSSSCSSSSCSSSSSSEDEAEAVGDDGPVGNEEDDQLADEAEDAVEEKDEAENEQEEAPRAAREVPQNLDETAQDTGYESGQSGEQKQKNSNAPA